MLNEIRERANQSMVDLDVNPTQQKCMAPKERLSRSEQIENSIKYKRFKY